MMIELTCKTAAANRLLFGRKPFLTSCVAKDAIGIAVPGADGWRTA